MRTIENFVKNIEMCCCMCMCYIAKKAVNFYARLNV